MSKDESAHQIVRQWVLKAENDLIAARHLLTLEGHWPTDVICFHAQQCVEKYLKAPLTLLGIAFPKTHDIERIISLIPKPSNIPLSDEQQALFSDYAAASHYPGDFDLIDLNEAKNAVMTCESVRKARRGLLPKEVLESLSE